MAADIRLGRFHRVIAAGANHLFISVMDHTLTEYLIPIYPIEGFQIQGGFGDLSQAQGAMNIPFLEFRDVNLVRITPDYLEVRTKSGDTFWWYLHKLRTEDEISSLEERSLETVQGS